MSFDLFIQQQQILAQLAAIAGSIALTDNFSLVDLTDGNAATGAQTRFIRLTPVDQTARSALHDVVWSFDVLVDIPRASDAEKTAAAKLFSDALAALIGWEFAPGRIVRTAPGQESGFDGRTLRISFGFTIPVYLSGS